MHPLGRSRTYTDAPRAVTVVRESSVIRCTSNVQQLLRSRWRTHGDHACDHRAFAGLFFWCGCGRVVYTQRWRSREIPSNGCTERIDGIVRRGDGNGRTQARTRRAVVRAGRRRRRAHGRVGSGGRRIGHRMSFARRTNLAEAYTGKLRRGELSTNEARWRRGGIAPFARHASRSALIARSTRCARSKSFAVRRRNTRSTRMTALDGSPSSRMVTSAWPRSAETTMRANSSG